MRLWAEKPAKLVAVAVAHKMARIAWAIMAQSNPAAPSLNKDSPVTRPVETVGRILPVPILGGLHHQYVRI